MNLANQKCEVCRVGAPVVYGQELSELLAQLPEWQVVEEESVKKLTREFKFADFTSALKFTNQVGEIAEAEGHHPVIVLTWGLVKVTWWTHKIGGLHQNDFIMAAKTDQLLNSA